MVILVPFDDNISNYEIENALTERGYPSLVTLRTIIIIFLRNLYPNNVDSINKKVQENIKKFFGKEICTLTLVDLMDYPIGLDSKNRIYFYTDSPRLYRIYPDGCFESVTDTKEEVEELINSLNSESIKEKNLKYKIKNVILKYIDITNEYWKNENKSCTELKKKYNYNIPLTSLELKYLGPSIIGYEEINIEPPKKKIEEINTEQPKKKKEEIIIIDDDDQKMKNEEVIIINNNNGKKNENINKIRKEEEEEEENKIKIIKKRKISINKKLLKKYIDNLNYSINKLKEIVDSYCE
ncbi:hypothetical protein LY90DRAFT_671276 [Neocallimastix californiae]|uniref:Uncharacterized protein n=1 Tax=Neocallimastix californiae TaxID=1754190 RepID=A0A1Y2CI93_9FUNG|nr:hypothetical protein LY90DRAFT_671276 [Neocallimastix californiae]|eukprot:ORY46732.1 hypothetical protein LY90DRAFT_671276 [Neocallimastix californiae]